MKEILEKEYEKLNKLEVSPRGKVNILNNIIQFKLNENDCLNYKNDLSIDIKRYLNSLVNLAENGARNYDIINENMIEELLNNFNYEEKIKYLDYLIRVLEKSAFKEDIKKFQKLRYTTIINQSKADVWNVNSLFNLVIYYPLVSVKTLIITLLIVTFLANVILLPAPYEFMGLMDFKITYLHLSEQELINHVLNVTSSLLGVNSSFSVIPQDEKSMLFLILGKIFLFSYVISLVFNKLTELIKR